ncbi:MAG: citramalate synthase [Magnetococcales bacterium]|nr:citramalate synthase [Magnetococcales bacterium]
MHESASPILIYDTTLRDGAQSEDVLFSVADKLRITERLDELGIDVVEGGWPGSNPKDVEYFQQVRNLQLGHARVSAFGSTRRADTTAATDPILQSLLQAETPVVTIFGKSWNLHVIKALEIPLEANLELIFESVRFLKERVETVYYDAEHFFDGFKADPEYALRTLQAARDGGADCLVLCDTNGGASLHDIPAIVARAATLGAPLGIHCHNDSGLAVANTLLAVEAGAVHVQGTINGLGERCGNADLTSVIPHLALKMHKPLRLQPEQVQSLTRVSRFVNEMANRSSQKNQPFVGASAFAHKGGIHVSAILKDARTYEHITPESVGNRQRVLVSEQAGRSNLFYKLKGFGIDDVEQKDPRILQLLNDIKELEHKGYQFDGAEASFELRARRALGQIPDYFTLHGFRVIDERREEENGEKLMLVSDASVKVSVGDHIEHTAAEGKGPVNALDQALRKALTRFYANLGDMTLSDFKVRIISDGGTAAQVRVQIESRDGNDRWGTVGTSENIIAAAYQALVDAVVYKLYKDRTPALNGKSPGGV